MVDKASLKNWVEWEEAPESFDKLLEEVREGDAVDSYELGGLYAHYGQGSESEQIHVSSYLPDEEVFEDMPFQPILFLKESADESFVMLQMNRNEYLDNDEEKVVELEKELYTSLLDDCKEAGLFEVLDGEEYNKFLEEVER